MRAVGQARFDVMLDLDPDTLVFLDETVVVTDIAHRYDAPRVVTLPSLRFKNTYCKKPLHKFLDSRRYLA